MLKKLKLKTKLISFDLWETLITDRPHRKKMNLRSSERTNILYSYFVPKEEEPEPTPPLSPPASAPTSKPTPISHYIEDIIKNDEAYMNLFLEEERLGSTK